MCCCWWTLDWGQAALLQGLSELVVKHQMNVEINRNLTSSLVSVTLFTSQAYAVKGPSVML